MGLVSQISMAPVYDACACMFVLSSAVHLFRGNVMYKTFDFPYTMEQLRCCVSARLRFLLLLQIPRQLSVDLFFRGYVPLYIVPG